MIKELTLIPTEYDHFQVMEIVNAMQEEEEANGDETSDDPEDYDDASFGMTKDTSDNRGAGWRTELLELFPDADEDAGEWTLHLRKEWKPGYVPVMMNKATNTLRYEIRLPIKLEGWEFCSSWIHELLKPGPGALEIRFYIKLT